METAEAQIIILASAFLLDLVFKDPTWLYHPVRAVGFLASKLERVCRRIFGKNLKMAGVFFLAVQLIFWYAVISESFFFLSRWYPFIETFFLIYITYSMLAFGSLVNEVAKVKNFLEAGDREGAQETAQNMVSRSLKGASEKEIIRATLESATENLSDAVIAPLFYFYIGGPILMFLYKVVNTLDSMVGYRNQKYSAFGWASARFDDLVNLIPARITGVFIVIVAAILGDSPKGAFSAWVRDGQKGPSPNGGIPITAFAGARNIRLGGPCRVEGVTIDIPFVGGHKESFGTEEINSVLNYVRTTTVFVVSVVVTLLFVF